MRALGSRHRPRSKQAATRQAPYQETAASQSDATAKAAVADAAAPPSVPLAIYKNWPKPDVALVLTGQQLGYIEPCGCTGLENQKGGLARRHTLLRQLAGDLGWNVVALDVGSQVKGFGKQQEVKFAHTVQGLRTMGYRAATLGDGGVYSNIEDLAKWDDALWNHTLLSEKEMQPALTPVKLNDGSEPHWPTQPNGDNLHPGKPVSYGFGWFLDPYNGQARMWHTGSTMGFRTVIERFPGENLTVIVLSNRTDLDPEKLSLQAADLFRPAKKLSLIDTAGEAFCFDAR